VPAFPQVGPLGLMDCPPQIQKIGTAVTADIYDADNPPFRTSIIKGALPNGLALVPRMGLDTQIKGTPSKIGSYPFTIEIVDDFAHKSQSIDCVVDVVAADSIVERIGGINRYEEAVLIADKIVPIGTTTPLVYVASGENFSDALSASAIAAQHGAPLILTTPTDLPDLAFTSIHIMQPSDVVIVGGPASVGQEVIDQINSMSDVGTVTRIGGADRFAVSRNLISDPKFGAMASTSIYAASGLKFPDALSASPAAAKIKTPVLLVNGEASSLTPDEKALLTSRGVTNATVFGGEDTLSAALAADMKTVTGSLSRIEGADRFVVSANITAANYTAPIDTVYFATGANYPDALAGGVLAGIDNSPILLVRKNCVQPEVADQVRRLAPKHIVLLGGPNSLDATLENLPLCS
jgi:putative cell wall-binding protein